MYLYVAELRSNTLGQQITIGSADINLVAVRAHLYRNLSPAGSLFINIADANGVKIKQSGAVAISSLDPGANYSHGYYKFPISFQLKANSVYVIQLVSSGYTYSDSAFVGWCNDFDLRKVQATYSPNTLQSAALDFELWEQNQFLRRTG